MTILSLINLVKLITV